MMTIVIETMLGDESDDDVYDDNDEGKYDNDDMYDDNNNDTAHYRCY